MNEIVTVAKIGSGNPFYQVMSSQRKDGTKGALGAFTKELEALQYARRHHEQHRGAPYYAVLTLTREQHHVLELGTSGQSATVVVDEQSDFDEQSR